MNLGSTIEKIKREEQCKEAKLKAKREQEAASAAAERATRDAVTQLKKLHEQEAELTKKTDELHIQVTIHKIRRDALSAQLSASSQKLEELRAKAEKLTKEVQAIRVTYCNAVQEASDEYGVWALLTKPSLDSLPCKTVPLASEAEKEDTLAVEQRLKVAMERREKAITERERLKSEPDNGEEFIRKCLLQYRHKRLFSKRSEIEADENEPIKFSTSPAAQKTIKPIIIKKSVAKSMPWYQPYSVIASVAIFMIYFCLLREENDMDQEFTKTLYERIKGLEKQQLLQSYKFNKEHGKSVADIEERLKELDAQAQTEHAPVA